MRIIRFIGISRETSVTPRKIRELEPRTPTVRPGIFPNALIREIETPIAAALNRVGLLDRVRARFGFTLNLIATRQNVLLAHDCEVITPRLQFCCGSLHAPQRRIGNSLAKMARRRNILAFSRTFGLAHWTN